MGVKNQGRGGTKSGGQDVHPSPGPTRFLHPNDLLSSLQLLEKEMKQVFFLSHFDLGFADLQCKIQNWIFQLRSSKSNRFGTNQFFIPQMKADLSSKKASFSNLRLQKMEDIRGQFTNYVDKFLGFLDHLPPLR